LKFVYLYCYVIAAASEDIAEVQSDDVTDHHDNRTGAPGYHLNISERYSPSK